MAGSSGLIQFRGEVSSGLTAQQASFSAISAERRGSVSKMGSTSHFHLCSPLSATNHLQKGQVHRSFGGFCVFSGIVFSMRKVTIFTDGGARGNPGPAAIGVQYLDEKKAVLGELSEYIGEATNNVAEYAAVKRALEHLPQIFDDTKAVQVTFYLDSQLVERQLNGVYKIKDQNLKTYADAIKVLERECASIEYNHVRRAENKEADRLVNEALDAQEQ